MTFSNIISVDICIATYKRPDLLNLLLKSLAEQTIINSIKLRIIIIDNDFEKSAKPIVDAFFSNKDITYIYDVQPEKNISLTRNKALDYANADYLAFIDDDEYAAPDWLDHLLQTSKNYDADVIFGPVIPYFPEEAPDWIVKGGFFNQKITKTGEFKLHGATNNTLIRNPKSFKTILRFDQIYGLTGGEDTELFSRLYLNGSKLIWCNEAIVFEHIPPERMTVDWLVKRALRGGQIFAKVYLKELTFAQRIIWFFKRFTFLFIAIIFLPIAIFTGKNNWVWVLRKIMANFGQLSMIFSGNAYQEYK